MKTKQSNYLNARIRKNVVKKVFALIAIFTTILSFCSCGKSESVKKAEAQISTLSASSSYKEINDAYALYNALEYDEKEKVENSDELAKYISLESGGYTLNDEMIAKIKSYFDTDSYGLTTISKLNLDITAKKYGTAYGADWLQAEDFKFSSEEKTDNYTYTKYGKVSISTKYGNIEVHDFELNASVIYDEDTDNYKVSASANIFN